MLFATLAVRFALRLLFVLGLLLLATDRTPMLLDHETKLLVGFSTIPFYFALLAVEIFAARPILSGSQLRESLRTDSLQPTRLT